MSRRQSKATQDRHERMLNELFKLEGNDRCADCAAKNPRWASYSLGVFLCIRCASLHRKMGTHISKVKSCTMDCWTLPEIEKMKELGGNKRVNSKMNPHASSNRPIALDDDHVMERFIRDKWQRKLFSGGGGDDDIVQAQMPTMTKPLSSNNPFIQVIQTHHSSVIRATTTNPFNNPSSLA